MTQAGQLLESQQLNQTAFINITDAHGEVNLQTPTPKWVCTDGHDSYRSCASATTGA